MNSAIVFLYTLLAFAFANPQNKRYSMHLHPKFLPHTRIIHGKDAEPHSFPYQVYIKGQSSLYTDRCGGALIAPDIVLTAAHCLERATKLKVTLGAYNISNHLEPSQITVTSEKYKFHENWNEVTLSNDIGIIKLPFPVELSDAINTIPTPADSSQTFADSKANVTGWGKTADNPTNRGSEILKVLETRVMSNSECKSIPAYQKVIRDTHMCTDGIDVTGFCDGDSGGPLVSHGVLIGVISFSYKNCEYSMPSVYTRVTSYLDWIETNIDLLSE